jgi:hypothetical protein
MATGQAGKRQVVCKAIVLSLAVAATGCAGGARYAAMDSTPSACAQEYRQLNEQGPAPSHLSKKERGRYEDRARDYNVSQRCQREGEQGGVLWTSHPVDPIKPDFSGKRGD